MGAPRRCRSESSQPHVVGEAGRHFSAENLLRAYAKEFDLVVYYPISISRCQHGPRVLRHGVVHAGGLVR